MLRKVVLRTLNYKFRYFFDRWKHNLEREDLAEQCNSEGPVAVEAQKAKQRANVLKRHLKEIGYTPEQIEEYLAAKRAQQETDMVRFMTRAKLKGTPFEVLPRAME